MINVDFVSHLGNSKNLYKKGAVKIGNKAGAIFKKLPTITSSAHTKEPQISKNKSKNFPQTPST